MQEKAETGGSRGGENEGEEAAKAGSRRGRLEPGSAFSQDCRLHTTFEVASRCFANSFQDFQTMSLYVISYVISYRLAYYGFCIGYNVSSSFFFIYLFLGYM